MFPVMSEMCRRRFVVSNEHWDENIAKKSKPNAAKCGFPAFLCVLMSFLTVLLVYLFCYIVHTE